MRAFFIRINMSANVLIDKTDKLDAEAAKAAYIKAAYGDDYPGKAIEDIIHVRLLGAWGGGEGLQLFSLPPFKD